MQIMSRTIYKFKIENIKDYGSQTRQLDLKCQVPAEFKFKAGQFAMLHVPADPKPILRAYSIGSDDRITSGFRLIFKHVENGVASKFVWGLKGDEILNFTGPFGKLFFPKNPPKKMIMLSTSTGLAPHISYLESKSELYPNIQYRLLIGVRTEQDIFCTDILENLRNKLPDMKYEFVLSRPSPTWTGKKGYVQDFVDEFSYFSKPTTFFLCGNSSMIDEVKVHLINRSFEKSHIISESYD
jgi:ferredoxin-NADP reductase